MGFIYVLELRYHEKVREVLHSVHRVKKNSTIALMSEVEAAANSKDLATV